LRTLVAALATDAADGCAAGVERVGSPGVRSVEVADAERSLALESALRTDDGVSTTATSADGFRVFATAPRARDLTVRSVDSV
jgi:hypothetical protein